ncbi:uncharacterized protein LOC130797944 [Amaranthus tricolor]|uniref:uncharacterized protein LOC130797944 n=1 Tax=Amaranthus tricolor TaxID=29722 RepID=UPI00258C4C53|nr:uncharacterized protein LOC130797944 [Amaranthus tricolor]
MTLEDFLTSTEMKDGFTTPAHVEELINVMQKQKDSSVKSVHDATRQWAAVASTIAATERRECLDLFVQLDGLWFIDRWLRDAQIFPHEASDCFVEEAISALLHAVEKLQINPEKLSSSGICITVGSLSSYKSTRVQDKAKALFDRWKTEDLVCKRMDVEQTTLDNQAPGSNLSANNATCARSLNKEKLECVGKWEDKFPSDQASSIEGDLVKEEVCPSKGLYADCDIEAEQGTDEMALQVEQEKHENKLNMSSDTPVVKVTSACGVSDCKDMSSRTDAKSAEEAIVKPDMGESVVKEGSPYENTSACNTNSPVCKSSSEIDDDEENGLDQGNRSALEEFKDQEATISRSEDDDDEQSEKSYLGNSCEFVTLTKHKKGTDIIQQTRDLDLEDGTVDALEVARLVAKEVEREVGAYCEQSGTSSSSSDGESRDSIRESDSPKSINGVQDMPIDGPLNQSSATENTSDATTKAPLMSLANLETNLQNHTQDGESSLVTEVAREPENREKSFLDFDLNQEFSSEDGDQVETTSSNPVSVVSASRAIVASGIPTGPLQFEGSLGWKGSAATSAFRPASSRRAFDSDRLISGGDTSIGSRQRQNILPFDLNVAECVDDEIVNIGLDRHKQILPGLPSDESSVQVSPNKPQRFKLDLNQSEDDGGLLISEWKMSRRNCQLSSSPASSSSCMLPSMRNFDLNDKLLNCNDSADHSVFLGESSHKVNPCMGSSGENVISILGAKVSRNAFPQMPLPFLNGMTSEPMMDANFFRGGLLMGLGAPVTYPLGFNGVPMCPTVSLESAQIYRPTVAMPYVFESRGAPFLPQMLGSASTIPPSFGQPSLVMNTVNATPGPNLATPLRPPILDLNSGLTNVVEARNPDPAFFRPLFIPHSQGKLSEEQLSLRDTLRPLGSGSGGGKRKEPDGGWNFYPTNYKHQQPPQL